VAVQAAVVVADVTGVVVVVEAVGAVAGVQVAAEAGAGTKFIANNRQNKEAASDRGLLLCFFQSMCFANDLRA
jgi:hypothetical protein